MTAGKSSLNAICDSARRNGIKIFVPFEEFNLPVGQHKLKIRADVVCPDYTDLAHLTYHHSQYTKSQ
ncbi:MAG TPA: hypothetical protein VMM38_08895 [Aridibacter sp.]|nr:hypothetical protein [Aridibacter sp.]